MKKLVSIIPLLFIVIAKNNYAQSLTDRPLMEYAILYVDSLLENKALYWGFEQKVYFSKDNSLLRVFDEYDCWIRNKATSEIIDSVPVGMYYKKNFNEEYELTHMSMTYYEPTNIIKVSWCNKYYSDFRGKYVLCTILFHHYLEQNTFNRLIVLSLFVEDNHITRYEINSLVD